MIDPTSPSHKPSPRARQLTRAFVTLVLLGLTASTVLSLLLLDMWRQDRSNALWHIALDIAFGLCLTALVVWLAQRTITQMDAAEQALRHSEERYRTLIENQGEGICFVDENENLTFANPAANEIFGMETGSLEGYNLNEFLPPEEFMAARRETEVRRTGQTSTYETRIICPDGRARTLLVTARPRFDENGTFQGTFSIFRDVTERKQAEEELARTRVNLEHRNQQLTQILEAGNLLRMTACISVWGRTRA